MTPEEFAHFLIMQLNGGRYAGAEVLRPDTVAQMQSQQYTAHPGLGGVGHSLIRGRLGSGQEMLWASGEIDNFNNRLVLIPSAGIGIYRVVNTGSGEPLHLRVAEAVGRLLPSDEQGTDTAAESGMERDEGVPHCSVDGRIPRGVQPYHGWGKWLRALGGFTTRVSAAGPQALLVQGDFQSGNPEQRERRFVRVGGGLFQEEGGVERLVFQQKDGQWGVTGTDAVELTRRPVWNQSLTLFTAYVALSILFVLLLLIWLVVYMVRVFRRIRRPSLLVGLIALLNAGFAVLQFAYGNRQIIYGYPGWYSWGVSSLPLLAAVLAAWLLLQRLSKGRNRGWAAWGRMAVALYTLVYTGYLYYWNLLSVHYS